MSRFKFKVSGHGIIEAADQRTAEMIIDELMLKMGAKFWMPKIRGKVGGKPKQ